MTVRAAVKRKLTRDGQDFLTDGLINKVILNYYYFIRRCWTMAVPKRRVSKARRDKRRSNVWKLDAPTLVRCKQCGAYTVPHKVCAECGYYKGKQVVVKDED